MKFVAVTVLAALNLAWAKELPTFEEFLQLHSRSYQHGSAEFEERKALYQTRIAAAHTHNSNANKMWTAGVNKLWDWTEGELKSLRGWVGGMTPKTSGRAPRSFLQRVSSLPSEKDWYHLTTFSYTKNQGSCGSCWAIATQTVVEAHHEIYRGNHAVFSTQQIVECTPNPRKCGGEGGCKGATAELAMDWILNQTCHGNPCPTSLALAAQVPYTATDHVCQNADTAVDAVANNLRPALGLTGYETLPKNEYEPLMRALAERGPVAVSVAADAWYSYDSGIFDGCGKDSVIDHAVVAIGYGATDGKAWWDIQNSWGQDWGDDGRIKLQRHTDGDYCGMNNDPQKGVACQGETDPVPVCGMCGVLFDSVVPYFTKSS